MRLRDVTVYMRIEGQEEVPVGTARSIAQIPVMLRALAERWEQGLRPDVLEEGSGSTNQIDSSDDSWRSG